MGNTQSHPRYNKSRRTSQQISTQSILQPREPTVPRESVVPAAPVGSSNPQLGCITCNPEPLPPYNKSWLSSMPEVLKKHLKDKQSPVGKALPTCEPCRRAQSEPDYLRRITRLQDVLLYCSRCKAEHSMFFFSPKERQNNRHLRQCVAYEGILETCPHLRFNNSQIIRMRSHLKAPNLVRIILCEQLQCPYRTKVTITKTTVTLDWEIKVDTITNGSNDIFWQTCMDQLNLLIHTAPEGFCPHFRACPYQLTDPISLRDSINNSIRMLRCTVCETDIKINKTKATMSLSRSVTASAKYHHIIPNRFLMLSTDSYQLFEDAETKHSTWCDNRLCQTTFELGRHALYVRLLDMTEWADRRSASLLYGGDEFWREAVAEDIKRHARILRPKAKLYLLD